MKVELLDFMGTDLDVVNAARVSFDKESTWKWENDWEHDCELHEKEQVQVQAVPECKCRDCGQ